MRRDDVPPRSLLSLQPSSSATPATTTTRGSLIRFTCRRGSESGRRLVGCIEAACECVRFAARPLPAPFCSAASSPPRRAYLPPSPRRRRRPRRPRSRRSRTTSSSSSPPLSPPRFPSARSHVSHLASRSIAHPPSTPTLHASARQNPRTHPCTFAQPRRRSHL